MTNIQRPCRFCGEDKRITFSERGSEENIWGIDPNGQVVRGPTGEPTSEGDAHGDDLICCDVCGVWVPARIWNASPAFLALLRANVLAADAEYDDDGVWRGPPSPPITALGQPAADAALTARTKLVREMAELPDDTSDDDLNVLSTTAGHLERIIWESGDRAAQIALTMELWEEGAPLIPQARQLLEKLATEGTTA